jgi:hypothetical protein
MNKSQAMRENAVTAAYFYLRRQNYSISFSARFAREAAVHMFGLLVPFDGAPSLQTRYEQLLRSDCLLAAANEYGGQ